MSPFLLVSSSNLFFPWIFPLFLPAHCLSLLPWALSFILPIPSPSPPPFSSSVLLYLFSHPSVLSDIFFLPPIPPLKIIILFCCIYHSCIVWVWLNKAEFLSYLSKLRSTETVLVVLSQTGKCKIWKIFLFYNNDSMLSTTVFTNGFITVLVLHSHFSNKENWEPNVARHMPARQPKSCRSAKFATPNNYSHFNLRSVALMSWR